MLDGSVAGVRFGSLPSTTWKPLASSGKLLQETFAARTAELPNSSKTSASSRSSSHRAPTATPVWALHGRAGVRLGIAKLLFIRLGLRWRRAVVPTGSAGGATGGAHGAAATFGPGGRRQGVAQREGLRGANGRRRGSRPCLNSRSPITQSSRRVDAFV